MTQPKLKYELYPWLLHTQFVEICEADTPAERADECADLITVALEYIQEMGFDPLAVYSKRVDDKSPDFKSIHRKYRDRFAVILDEINGKKE